MEPTRITVDETKQRLDRGEQLVFVDARNSEAWAKATHKLPGAVRIPAGELDKHLSEIPPNRAVITYCTCPHEASAAQVGQELLDRGFKNVHALYGGFDAWRDEGNPVESKETRSSKGAGES